MTKPSQFRLLLVALVLASLLPRGAWAQPYTTVITHGFSSGSKGVWVQGMAEAIIARAGTGSVYRYDEADGLWHFVPVAGGDGSNDVIALIFNWVPESAGVSNGPNWNYAQAAADALYAAMRDPRYTGGVGPTDLAVGRTLHFIGHSRGACVNSEAALRLAREGITVDQMTSLDPHPVNGTLDARYNLNWGDPVPQKWSNTTFADDCWRADGGGIINGLDFDGIPLTNNYNTLLSESALNCCAYSFSHLDVHLWYHGTIDLSPAPCDGEQCINATMRNTWWPEGYTQRGWFYSALGGGADQRPAQPAGIAPVASPLVYNGDFTQGSYAGWSYHGGLISGQVALDAGNNYLRIGAGAGGNTGTHNRFFLPSGATDITFAAKVFTPGAGQSVEVSITDRDGLIHVLASFGVPVATGWQSGYVVPIDCDIPRGRDYTVTFKLTGPGAITAVVGIDDVAITLVPQPGDVTGEGQVNIDDLLAVINAWGDCPAPPAACNADAAPSPQGDGVVNIDDLLTVINGWTTCP